MAKQVASIRDLWDELHAEAKAQGPKALAEFERVGHRYRIGGELSVLRTRLGLSQTQLAKTTGINQAEISRIERGASNATADTLARLADALGAEIRILRDEDRALARLPEFARSRAKADAEIANGRSIEAGAFFCAETPPPGLKHSATRGRSSKTRRA